MRYTDGTTPTKYIYTGQYSHMGDVGLMFYNARWYDPVLGRFAQADVEFGDSAMLPRSGGQLLSSCILGSE